MGGGGQTTQQTTKVDLSPEQQQLLNMAMPFAQKYGENQPVLPSGSSVAGFTDPQKAGQAATLAAAGPGGAVGGTAADAAAAHDFLTSGKALDPSTNPGLAAAIKGAVQPIEENYSENIIPQIKEGGVGVGQFGGGREGALEGIASQAEQRAIGATAGGIETQAYEQGLDQMTRALGLSPTVQQAELEPGAATSSVGDVQQQLEQQQLTEAFNKFMFPQTQPLSTAEALAGVAGAIPGGGTTTTGNIQSSISPWQMAAGAGGLAAGLLGSGGIASLAPLFSFL